MRFFVIMFFVMMILGGCKETPPQEDTIKPEKKAIPTATAEQKSMEMPAVPDTIAAKTAEEVNQKLEPALTKHLADLTRTQQDTTEVKIVGKYENLTEEELKHLIRDLGGEVMTVTKSTFTLRCPANCVSDVAKIEGISYLELSKERHF